ncbi:MAG: hypothetical protein JXQ90_09590 [Cyclobacteriaceae bacterium]
MIRNLLLLTALTFSCSQSSSEKPVSALDIILKNDCLHCHGIEDKVIGPSYLEISRRYTSSPTVKSELISKIKNGGGGKWYGGVMSKHPFLKQAELKTLVNWILSIDNRRNEVNQRLSFTENEGAANMQVLQYERRPRNFSKLDESIVQIFSRKANSLALLGDSAFEHIPTKALLKFEGSITIDEPAKYFFRLLKTGQGELHLNQKTIIRKDAEDHELSIDLAAGTHKLSVFYLPTYKDDTLALSWIAPGMEYYENIRFD